MCVGVMLRLGEVDYSDGNVAAALVPTKPLIIKMFIIIFFFPCNIEITL
jgi:hypothetical protein